MDGNRAVNIFDVDPYQKHNISRINRKLFKFGYGSVCISYPLSKIPPIAMSPD